MKTSTIATVLLLVACAATGAEPANTSGASTVDFRYALPWWQTSICLPDDPEKPLMGKEGQFLFDYGTKGGPRNFAFSIAAEVEEGAKWLRQETASAKAPIVRTAWDADGIEVLSEAFQVIPGEPGEPITNASPPQQLVSGAAPASHRYAVLLTLKNPSCQVQSRRPVVRIVGVAPVKLSDDGAAVAIGSQTLLLASASIESCQQEGKSWIVRLAPIEVPPGQTRQAAFTILRHSQPPYLALSVEDAARERDRAIRWWETAELPWDTIQVPDLGVEAMLQSSVRNIWQAREIKEGQPAFHVGPTVYRGLWVVDGSFLLEAAALVGRAQDARAGIHYILGFQQPDGRMQVMRGGLFHKENGIVLWMCCRHAALTQDKAWLGSIWPKLEKMVAAVQRLREESRTQAPGLQAGLMPTGFTDGGIRGNLAEYSNVYWNLAGLKAIIDAAEWLGKKDQALQWRREYDDFMATFRKAAARDMAVDASGNRYLPTIMGDDGKKELPQRGQWAFMHAVYPGQVFAQEDPLVLGNLAMLRATKQQGLVFGTGWDAEGIWTYAASFYGHAVLWQGHGREAAEVLYDYANHAAPVRVWREEQRPVGKGGHEVGDMPHNWASAEFIRLATHLLELDRGNQLHLLEGMPSQWLGPGMTTRLEGVATPFGPLYLTVQVDRSGKTATLRVKSLRANCKAVVVHLPDGRKRKIPAQQGGVLTFPIVNKQTSEQN